MMNDVRLNVGAVNDIVLVLRESRPGAKVALYIQFMGLNS